MPRPTQEKDELSPVLEVAAQVVAAIRDGQLAPGQRLIETDFAKRLGVARTTVREAFQRLEAEGLLAIERHRGFLVRTLTRAKVREIYQVREVLEGLAARLAAPHFKADGAQLRDVVSRLDDARAQSNIQNFTRGNRDFHNLIRTRSGNELVQKTLATLEHSVYHYQYRLLVQSAAVFDGQDEHIAISNALFAGNGTAAELAMKKHIRHSLDELLQLPDTFFGDGIPA
jgi:DNA-binding GntR family transcriptional regulator